MFENNPSAQNSSEKYIELYEERRHLENLLNTRFNFFIVVFASILASLFTVKNFTQFLIILIIGALIESALAIVIARAQFKLKFFLNEIRKTENHAEKMADLYANSKKTNLCFIIRHSCNPIIGYIIPIVISSCLIISWPVSKLIYNSVVKGETEKEIKINLKINDDVLKTYKFTLDTTKNISLIFSLKNQECKMGKCIHNTIK
jgi:multisubunit Na+/H+ antiporter MnhG subunit